MTNDVNKWMGKDKNKSYMLNFENRNADENLHAHVITINTMLTIIPHDNKQASK